MEDPLTQGAVHLQASPEIEGPAFPNVLTTLREPMHRWTVDCPVNSLLVHEDKLFVGSGNNSAQQVPITLLYRPTLYHTALPILSRCPVHHAAV